MRKILVLLAAMGVIGAVAACDPPPPVSDFPNATNTGADETLIDTVIDHDITITADDTTMQNVRFTNGADVFVHAANFHLFNSVFEGGRIDNQEDRTVHNGMVLGSITFTNPPGMAHNPFPDHIYYRVGIAGYAASHIKILNQQEGFRDGGFDIGGEPIFVQDSFVQLDTFGDARWNGSSWVPDEGTNHVNISDPNSPNNAPCDGHPDGIQGYVGVQASVVHNTFDLSTGPDTCNDAPIFIADNSQGGDFFNNAALGGGYSIRLHEDGVYRVQGNRISHDFGFGPFICNQAVSVEQSDNQVATFDSDYHVVSLDREVTC